MILLPFPIEGTTQNQQWWLSYKSRSISCFLADLFAVGKCTFSPPAVWIKSRCTKYYSLYSLWTQCISRSNSYYTKITRNTMVIFRQPGSRHSKKTATTEQRKPKIPQQKHLILQICWKGQICCSQLNLWPQGGCILPPAVSPLSGSNIFFFHIDFLWAPLLLQ